MLIVPVSPKKFGIAFGRMINDNEAYSNNYYIVNEKAGVIVDRETGSTEFVAFDKIEATEQETMKLLTVISPKAPDPLFVSEKEEYGVIYEEQYYAKKLRVSKAKARIFSLLPLWLFLFALGIIVSIRG